MMPQIDAVIRVQAVDKRGEAQNFMANRWGKKWKQ